jgi:hypothetical protein
MGMAQPEGNQLGLRTVENQTSGIAKLANSCIRALQ